MAKYVIEDTTLINMADAIREKTGGTEPITPSNFATEIAGIQSGGDTTKGIIINGYNENGYVTDISIVGITNIPMNFIGNDSGGGSHWLTQYLTTVTLPDNLTEINNNAFAYCEKMELSQLPNTIEKIAASAFRDCFKITIKELPKGLTQLGQYAFRGCSEITIKEIPSGITSFPQSVFYGCKKISEMTLRGVITALSSSLFRDCTNLKKIVFPNVTQVPSMASTSVFQDTPIASGTGYIYVPDDLVDSFKIATNWSTYVNQIKPISELEASE